jgi:hypothetical protein
VGAVTEEKLSAQEVAGQGLVVRAQGGDVQGGAALAAATASWLVGHEHADLGRSTADTLDVLLTGLSGTKAR